ncbi:MAG: DNA cytosine methyltransferase [Gemmatimonadota bacterium]|nr:DNA cytosine methyltransferase [Gemmatimonadota bacterium]
MTSSKMPPIKPIRVFDFFSGCGGTSLGFHESGIEHALAVDSCPDAIGTFKKNFTGASVINEPIETVAEEDVRSHFSSDPEVRLFCGCAPCQPFTKQKTNSSQKSSEDNRHGLLGHFSSIVHKCLPDLVFVENVPGILNVTIEGQTPLSALIDQLDQDDYFSDHGVIYAQDYGVPQVRRRLVLVASRLGEIALPKATHGPNRPAAYNTVRDAIADLPPIEQGTEHRDKLQYPNHRAAALSELNLKRIRKTRKNGRRDWPDSLLPKCYTAKENGERYNGHSDCYTRLAWDEPAPGLTTRCISYSNGRFGHPKQDRALSVREAARLQGFPDSFEFTGSLASMARQIGNAVPVPVAKAFGLHFNNHVNTADQLNG